MTANPRPDDRASNASGAEQAPPQAPPETHSVAEMLQRHLMAQARGRKIRQAVGGGRFCAVMLDDGGVGLANLCPDVCGQPSRGVLDQLPRPGTPAVDALATLVVPRRSAVGLATANALANRPAGGWQRPGHADSWGTASRAGDLLDVLELRPDDQVGMVGCFSPLVERIRHRVRQLLIFERGPRQTPGSPWMPMPSSISSSPMENVGLPAWGTVHGVSATPKDRHASAAF